MLGSTLRTTQHTTPLTTPQSTLIQVGNDVTYWRFL